MEVPRHLEGEGLTLIVVDKNIAPLATYRRPPLRGGEGRVVWQGDSPALLADTRVLHEYLGCSEPSFCRSGGPCPCD
jgi:hypothetical protein